MSALDNTSDSSSCGQAESRRTQDRKNSSSLLTGAFQITGEQTNTSIVLPNLIMAGAPNGVITKVLRYPAPVPHPDVEVPRALHRVGYHGVPKALGFTTAELPDGEVVTTSIASELIPDAEDGFELACAFARNNKSFASHAEKLGETIAQLHNALAIAFPVTTMRNPADFVGHLHMRAENAFTLVPELAGFRGQIAAQYDSLRDSAFCESFASSTQNDAMDVRELSVQRIHGDLHLGQTLFQTGYSTNRSEESTESFPVILRDVRSEEGVETQKDGQWFVLDFEGEPLRPADERSKPDFPERDVAGMVRSFSYAAAVVAAALDSATHAQNVGRAWEHEAAASFLKGYQKQRPIDNIVLAALTLDKALYEAVYEHQHRPTWLHIPIAAIAELLGKNRVS